MILYFLGILLTSVLHHSEGFVSTGQLTSRFLQRQRASSGSQERSFSFRCTNPLRLSLQQDDMKAVFAGSLQYGAVDLAKRLVAAGFELLTVNAAATHKALSEAGIAHHDVSLALACRGCHYMLFFR